MTVSQQQQAYLARVLQQILDDLTYPVGKDGSVLDTNAFKAIVGWHLVRAGWRKPNNTDEFPLVEEFDDPLIKSRKVAGPGVMEDAVTWVPATDPDDPLDDLQNMTMAQIEALPDDLRTEAKRRLGLIPALPTADPDQGWSVKPYITISDAEDVDDQTDWAAMPERS